MENSNKEHWNNPQPVRDNKKLAAGILALLLAPFGVHKFLLGYTKEGIIWLVISLVTCGSVTTLWV
jgi:TM2 domain-containing membrane protein YozV